MAVAFPKFLNIDERIEEDRRHPVRPSEAPKCVYLLQSSHHWDNMLAGLGYVAIGAEDELLLDQCVAVIVEHRADPDLDQCRMLCDTHNVILISEDDSFSFRLAAARAGINAVLPPSLDAADLGAWLSDFEDNDYDEHTILIVDDDDLTAETYALALRDAGMVVHVVNDAGAALKAVTRLNPELVLMDMHMPGASGIEVAQVLRQYRQNLSLPIVFLSAEKDEEIQREARRIGGDDFISKPVDLSKLVELVELRAKRAHALRQIMEKDSLTGLLNHARFKDKLMMELSRIKRNKQTISVGLLDLDHFKKINDTHGHQAGDVVIQTLAHSLRGWLRHTDVVARYGGEEFAVILLDTPLDAAQKVMDKIRTSFSKLSFETEGVDYNVTLSVGLATSAPDATVESIIRDADEALYSAKGSGRNCVKIAST